MTGGGGKVSVWIDAASRLAHTSSWMNDDRLELRNDSSCLLAMNLSRRFKLRCG